MDILGIELMDLPDGTMVTEITMLIQTLDPDGTPSLFLRSNVKDKVTRLGAITLMHTRCIAEVNESFEEEGEG